MAEKVRISFEMFDTEWNLGIIAFSLIALSISLTSGSSVPVDTAWFALVLCAVPIATKVFMYASAGRFDAYGVFVLLITVAAFCVSGVFAAACVPFLERFISSLVAIEGMRFEQ